MSKTLRLISLLMLIDATFSLALILGGDFFTASVLSTALTKLVLRFNEKTKDEVASNTLRAEVCPFFSLSFFNS